MREKTERAALDEMGETLKTYSEWGADKKIPSHIVKGAAAHQKDEVSNRINCGRFERAISEFMGRRII